MTDYRIYPLDDRGRLVSSFGANCRDDAAACAYARTALKEGAQAEVWSGARCVGRVVADKRILH